MLAGSGEHVEERGLAAVLLAREGKSEHCAFREGVFVVFGVVFAALAQARVGIVVVEVGVTAVVALFRFFGFGRFRHAGTQPDGGGIFLAQCQGIAPDKDLYRVAERGAGHHLHRGARGEPHIQKMHPADSFSAYRIYYGCAAYCKFIYSHYTRIRTQS